MSFIDTVDPNAHCLEKMMSGIADAVGDVLGGMGANAATIKGFQDAAKMAVVVAVVALGGGMNALQNGPKLLDMSGVVRDIALASGASKEMARQANKYFAVAVGIAATIAVIVIGSVATFGAATGPLVMAGISQTMGTVMRVASAVQMVVQLVAQAAEAGMTIASSVILADVPTIKGFLAGHKTMNDAEIQELLKLIKKLLASLNGAAEFLGDLTDTQKNLHGNAIQAIAG